MVTITKAGPMSSWIGGTKRVDATPEMPTGRFVRRTAPVVTPHDARRFGARMAAAAVTLGVVVAGCVLPTPPPPPPPPGAPALAISTEVAGLHKPWDIAFTPDGTMLFTQKAGTIDALVGGNVQNLATPTDAEAISEAGMMGLAVDPSFASNRSVFACFLANNGGNRDVRVVRFTVAADYASSTDRTDIITGIPVNATGSPGRHSGCRPRFGPVLLFGAPARRPGAGTGM